jgi:hypothetical protein
LSLCILVVAFTQPAVTKVTLCLQIYRAGSGTYMDKDLHEILEDASNCCDFTCDVDRNGETVVKINCVVDEDEKERVWDLMRFKHKRDCVISSEPSEL